jgi:hypothetical protein
MPFFRAGELFSHLSNEEQFDEETTKFFVA